MSNLELQFRRHALNPVPQFRLGLPGCMFVKKSVIPGTAYLRCTAGLVGRYRRALKLHHGLDLSIDAVPPSPLLG
jgi:hypothetical protein